MDKNGNITSHLSGILYRTSNIVEKGTNLFMYLMENPLSIKKTP